MTKLPQKKPDPVTFEVTYYAPDGTVKDLHKVYRAPFRGKPGLKDIQILQESLIKEFIEGNGAIGSLLADDKVWAMIAQLGSILYVVGKDKPGIDVEALATTDEVGQLARIFFSESFNEQGERELDGEGNLVLTKPSLISKIHGLDFYGPLFRLSDEKRNRERLEVLVEQNGKEEAPSLQETGK